MISLQHFHPLIKALALTLWTNEGSSFQTDHCDEPSSMGTLLDLPDSNGNDSTVCAVGHCDVGVVQDEVEFIIGWHPLTCTFVHHMGKLPATDKHFWGRMATFQ